MYSTRSGHSAFYFQRVYFKYDTNKNKLPAVITSLDRTLGLKIALCGIFYPQNKKIIGA